VWKKMTQLLGQAWEATDCDDYRVRPGKPLTATATGQAWEAADCTGLVSRHKSIRSKTGTFFPKRNFLCQNCPLVPANFII
jgi:hypothetical protein